MSYLLTYWLKRDVRWGRQVSLSIEPTNSCNLSCPQCPTGTGSLQRSKGLFSQDAFDRLLEEKAKDLLYLNFYFQGEPFINKDLPLMIKKASDKNVFTSVSTNAQLITEELAGKIVKSGLNRIIISIDGASQITYEKYRKGGQLAKVLEAVSLINEQKVKSESKQPKIVFQFLVFKHNEHEIAEIKALAEKYKADKLEIKSAQIYDYENNKQDITSLDKYSRYKKDKLGKYIIKNKLPKKCWRMWHSSVITQDLKVVPCCFDKDADYTIGDINKQTFIAVEKSSEFKLFRNKILNERSQIEICKNCTEGLRL